MAVKIKIYTLGCKVNQYDSGKLARELAQTGFLLVNKNADIAIINSCAVTKTAMIKSGHMIKIARKENPRAKITLAGCWPKVYEIKNVDADFVAGGIKKLIKQINNQYLKRPETASPVNAGLAMTDRARYFIKIQDGCEQFCSYCIIPYARGKLKSREEGEIIIEIKQAVKAGYNEIVLSGIHLGLYQSVIPAYEPESRIQRGKQVSAAPATLCSQGGRGLRIPTTLKLWRTNKPAMTNYNCAPRNDNLVNLIKKIIKIKNLGRIRLSSIEITEVTDEMIKLMRESNKICKHLHIPLQSGSDKILKLMNRPYDAKYFAERIKQIRRAVPDIAITTDVIVGFPGETEKNFRDTEKFIKQIKFSRLHVFPFSAHVKTPAAKFPGQVQEKIKARRAKILRELSIKLAEDFKKKFKGKELEIVVEQIKQNKIIGKTEYYFDVEINREKIKNIKFKIGEVLIVKY
ncbi:MAG: radical SAM protein [Candidatus Falkowbacteria bacterium]